MELDRWGRANITNDELLNATSLHRLTDRAIEEFGVTYPTALGYAKTVLAKLRKDAFVP